MSKYETEDGAHTETYDTLEAAAYDGFVAWLKREAYDYPTQHKGSYLARMQLAFMAGAIWGREHPEPGTKP